MITVGLIAIAVVVVAFIALRPRNAGADLVKEGQMAPPSARSRSPTQTRSSAIAGRLSRAACANFRSSSSPRCANSGLVHQANVQTLAHPLAPVRIGSRKAALTKNFVIERERSRGLEISDRRNE